MKGRPLLLAAAIFAALIIGVGLWLYTPDKSRAALEAEYARPPSTFVDAAGIRLHVRDTGPHDAPALIMLHGFGSSLHTWDAWAATLTGPYRVVRLDLPSFGLTGPDPASDYSDARTFAILLALMDRLGIPRATFVGNSMGGGIAWRFTAAQPDQVERLILVSPDGFRQPGEPPPSAGPRKLPFVITMMRYVLPSFLLRQNIAPSYGDPGKLTATTLARSRDMLLAAGNRDAILARMMQMTRPDPVPILRTIQVPDRKSVV